MKGKITFMNFSEMRQLKKLKLQLEIDLLGKLYKLTEELSAINNSGITTKEALNTIQKLQNLNEKELLKEIADNIKKEKSATH